MTRSPSDARKGSQLPRIESFPLYATTAAQDAIDIADAAGLVLDPWQQHVLTASLGERPDGRWSAFRTCLVVPRQNGKNAVLEARELAGLLLFNEQVIIHTAHEFKTAHKSMLALMNRLRLSPLMDYVKGFDGEAVDDVRDIDGFKTGNFPGITMKNGNQLQYAARSKGSGRGFTGDLVILDEAYALKSSEMDALLPTMAAKSLDGNPQVWFTSSAGMPDSDLLASLRQQGTDKTSDRLAYFEWSTADDADPQDVESWYESNPGLGYRISEEFIRDEYETLVGESGSDEGFKRERLGIWAKLGGESVFPAGLWASRKAEEVENPRDLTVAFAVDVPPSRDSATIAAAIRLPDGRVQVLDIDRRVGTSWVSTRLVELRDSWSPASIVVDAGSAAGALLPEFKRDGVRTHQLNLRDYGQACGLFYDMVLNKKLEHTDQDELNAAVEGATQSPLGETLWKWNRKNPVIDISPLVAVSLALHGLTVRAKNADRKRKVVVL